MKNKNNYSHKNRILIAGLILILIIFFNIFQVEASSDCDFSLQLENYDLSIRVGGKTASKILINSTSDFSEHVYLKGEWIGGLIPKNVTVNFSSTSGYPTFFSYINFTSNLDSEIGNFLYTLTAESVNKIKSINFEVKIDYNISISLQSEKDSYEKGQTIHIFGNISKTHDINLSNFVNISFQYDKWGRTILVPIKDDLFETYYNISYGDPEGIWNVCSKISQEDIIFSSEINITVIPPPDILRYNVILYSPPEEAVYHRGDTINISVFTTEAGIGVHNALITCIFSVADKISLTEIKDGYYQGSYKIPWEFQTGRWSLSIECIKNVSGSLKAGGSYTVINVKPATINLDLIEPSLNDFFIDDSITIKAKLTYPNEDIIEGAIITAKTPSCNVTLADQLNGTYLTNYKVNNKDLGSWFIEISAFDNYGNRAFATKTINIVNKEQVNIPFSTILGILIVGFIGFFAINIFRRNFSLQHLNDIEEEIKEEERLQNETAVKYYKSGSISRSTYDALMKQHTERLGELKKEKRKLKKL